MICDSDYHLNHCKSTVLQQNKFLKQGKENQKKPHTHTHTHTQKPNQSEAQVKI